MIYPDKLDYNTLLILAVFVSVSLTLFSTQSVFADSITATIPVDGNPWGIAANPLTNKIYVGIYNSQGNNISVVDGATNNIVATIQTPTVSRITVNPNTNMIYAGNGHTISIIDGSTNQVVKTVEIISIINDLKINPVTNKLYAVGYGYGCSPTCGPRTYFDVIDAATNNVTKHVTGINNQGIAIDNTFNKVYLAGGTIDVVDGSTDTVIDTISGVSNANMITVNALTNRLYAPYQSYDAMAIVDLTNNSVLTTIPVGSGPLPVNVNPNTNKIYVGLYLNGDSIAVIDGSTNNVLQTLTVGKSPIGIAVNPNTNMVYVSNQASSSVSVIDGSSSNASISSPPQNLQFTAGNSQVNLSWSAPSSDGGSPITNYNVYRSTSSGIETFLASAGNAISYTDNTVTNGQTYFYTVTAVNSAGESAPSNEASATPIAPATIPNSPTDLTSTTVSSSQIDLSWSAPSNDGGSPITGYQIERSADSGSTWNMTNTNSVSTTFSDTGLAPSTSYSYRVSATNSAGTGAPSDISSATTSNPPATSPSSPADLTSTAVSESQINLAWSSPASDGGSPITGYEIERSQDNGSTWSVVISDTDSTSTSYSDTGLSSSTAYTYRVSAINAVGTSSPSNTASATTSSPLPTGIILNNIQSTSDAATSDITISNFDTGSNNMLIVGVSANNADVLSITFGGVPLTNKAYSFYNNDAEIWYLTNPSGAGDITVTMNGPTAVIVGAYSFSGVDSANPIPTKVTKHNTTPNSPKISITTKYANSLILDIPSIWGGVTLGSPTCTNQWDLTIPDGITGASSSKMVPTISTASCGWTASSADFWDDVAIELKAAG